jgi:hypothetical protein
MPCKSSKPGDRHKPKPKNRNERHEKEMKEKKYATKGGKRHG